MIWDQVARKVSLKPFTTLKAGGNADLLITCRTADELYSAVSQAQIANLAVTPIGWGSNILPSDKGVAGLCVLHLSRALEFFEDGIVIADSGVGFQDLFLQCAQRSLGGLEFAVGIPGTLGGAMVSNAGAYRSNISEFVTRLEIIHDGERIWVPAAWMEFAYRDSVLRREPQPQVVILRVELALPTKPQKQIYDLARENQRQRISKQPPSASAGSFFKNVHNADLAKSLPGLTDGMRQNNVVPSGLLIEACGLKGKRLGGAAVGVRHANFILNLNGATATEIRSLATHVNQAVQEKFGVQLEEEALYLGDWSEFKPLPA